MLEPDGTVKVLDFGLAVALDLADGSRITSTGQLLGTPAYMAPEQVMAGMSAPASDWYALGCTLHEMLTGQQVFRGSTAFAVMIKQVDEPPPLWRLRRDLRVELDRMILRLLEKKPEHRPADAGEVYRLLLPFVAELTPLPGVLNPPALPSPARMYPGVVSRVFAGAPLPGNAAAPASEPASNRARQFDRSDLQRARREASSLMKQSRCSQAADVLAAAPRCWVAPTVTWWACGWSWPMCASKEATTQRRARLPAARRGLRRA